MCRKEKSRILGDRQMKGQLDALIVGGGPAGLAAAIALRLKGLDVLVADAMQPPIDKACGEGLMPDARGPLAALGVSISEEDGAPFDGITFLSGESKVAAYFPRGRGIGIRRLRLHSLLVERCGQLGVRIEWGTRVTIRSGEPVLLNGKACAYRYLVGADGQASRVRSWSGLDAGRSCRERFGARQHFRVAPWSRMVEVYWGDTGQAYVTPVAQDEVCVASVSRGSITKMDAMLAGLPMLNRHLESALAASQLRGGITTTRKLRRVTTGNVALVGDASGSVDAVTGEGLVLSFRQALLLAEAIQADDLALYQAGHLRIMRLPQMMSKLMLGMDRWAWIRQRAFRAFGKDRRLFAHMLDVHLGEQSLESFALRNGPRFGWLLLSPPTTLS